MPLASIENAIAELQAGRMIIVVDDEDRENEGDLVVAAEFATSEIVNFMAREARGLICVSLEQERIDTLELPQMVPASKNDAQFGTAFTHSVDAKEGTTTGISAQDRATTIQVLIDPSSQPSDLARPGHVFPLRAEPEGVLSRPGQTEASVDLARLAGLTPAAVICEIMCDDGTMARLPELEILAEKHDLRIVSVADLIAYRCRTAPQINRLAEAELPTERGPFDVIAFEDTHDQRQHLALVIDDNPETLPLVRLHSECLTGDALGSKRCDCGDQLAESQRRVAEAGHGAVVYLRQEGRGIGLVNKLRAYALQQQGLDTVEANHQLGLPADLRDYRVAAQILFDLGMPRVALLTNNPDKVEGLTRHGIEVVKRVPLVIAPTRDSSRYLATKRDKLGHLLPLGLS
jgi:3,4-dihydroxy 2-butanone 4-phosphate synthase/GTP cyclohydrolase II